MSINAFIMENLTAIPKKTSLPETVNNGIRMEHYTSVRDIPVNDWNRFVNRDSVGLETEHLHAVEASRINDIHPYYIIGYIDKEPIGIAYGFSIRIDLARMANIYPKDVVETVKAWKPGFMEMRIVEIGHLASLGLTVEITRPYTGEFLHALSVKVDEIAGIEKAELCIVRDIPGDRFDEFSRLKDYGFSPAMGFPIARMKLSWNKFEGYLASLKSRKRYNILKRRLKLLAPGISTEIIEDFAPYSERLAELWTNVAKRQNGYQHERLTPAYFEAMSRHLKGRCHVVAIKFNGKIAAFGLNLAGDREYFGVAEGLDYDLRDKYDLYSNNIFEALRVACELGKTSFNIGITTYDFKTFIGAEPDPCIYLIKSFKQPAYGNVYASLIQKNIIQPVNLHRVFRDSDKPDRNLIRDASGIITRQNNHKDIFAKHLRYLRADTIRAADLYAYCPVFESAQEPVIKHSGRDVIMLGTNSYLGLATHPLVKSAACRAIEKYGSGCSGSPMLNGTLDIHKELVSELARFIGKEDALVFSTGYQTNVGTVSALVNREDIVIMDERNHASLVDGALLSRATLVRYKHNDTRSLEQMLQKYADKPKLVVTDSLFSMEGTAIDLPEIIRLVKKSGARLMLDESHAIGVMGPTGRGVAEHYNLTSEVDIIMGTFSKSFASIGGFVAGDHKIIDTLMHTSRSHIFSASLPPASVAAVLAAIRIIDEEPERRTNLIKNARFLADGLRDLGFTTSFNGSAIIPVFCGNELLALAAFHKLLEEGVFVNPVTSPAVPKNREMLRVSVMATHDESMILRALEVFKRVRTPGWPSVNNFKNDN
jgi:8-amino-7-oxononanoate synthase